jgi:hypothetical protein
MNTASKLARAGPSASQQPASNVAARTAIIAGSRHHAIRPADAPSVTVDGTLLDKKVINP